MSTKIKITADSTCDLSAELIEKYGITITPLYVILDDKQYSDGVDIVPDDIFGFYDKTGLLPKTAARTIVDYMETFESLVKDGFEVIHISLSSEFSSSYQNAYLAAQKVGSTYVVDSRNLSTGSGLLVLLAAELAQEGKSAKEIKDILDSKTEKARASFVIDTLEYLWKGGRCSAVTAFGANLLKIKPMIVVKNGKMEVGGKFRGPMQKVILQYVEHTLKNAVHPDKNRIFITHTKCSDETIEAVRNRINELYSFNEILVTDAGSVISSHCGQNTLGILFFEE